MESVNMRTPLFHWTAYDQCGQRCKGIEPAVNAKWLIVQLLQREYSRPRCQRMYFPALSRQRLKAADITALFTQLAVTVKAGVPLLQALESIAATSKKPLFTWLLTDLQQQINQGACFSQALTEHPRYFNTMEIQLVALAELSGTLDSTLQQLAVQRQTRAKIKTQVKKALSYPCLVLLIGFIVTFVLLTCVVPKFQQLYDSFHTSLPWFTQLVLAVSTWLKRYSLLTLGIGILTAISLATLYRKQPRWRRWFDRAVLKLPVIGQLLRHSYLALWSRTLSTMLSSGIPLLQALEHTQDLTNNSCLRRAINDTARQIETGQSLYCSLKRHRIFTQDVTQLVALGEETGQLDQMLANVAEQLTWQVSTTVAQLSSLLEPIVMVVIGSLVGLLVVAMYLPIFNMGNII